MTAESSGFREAVIDLDAIASNVATLRAQIGTEHLIAVVKANAYGHGAVQSARAALAGGADLIGVADIREGIELRTSGIGAPILAWLHDPDVDFAEAVEADIELGLSSIEQLRAVGAAAGTARIQLKLETGLSRNGIAPEQWAEAFELARRLEAQGAARVTGIFSHVSNASVADDRAAIALFEQGLSAARAFGLDPTFVHIAATAAAIDLPESRYNTVRLGIGIYGLSPFADRTSADLGLTPAMTLRARVAAVRRVAANTGVSYDYTYRTSAATTLALVPLGYADGIPRHASNGGPVQVAGGRFQIAGRVAMDQFVVDVGDHPVMVGDEVIVFGDPSTGVPSADDWAIAAGTINYEIVTRIGGRIRHSYRGL
jgi:alanine racemase